MNPESVPPSGQNRGLPRSPIKLLALVTLLAGLSFPIGRKLFEVKRFLDLQRDPSLLISAHKPNWYAVKVVGAMDLEGERSMLLHLELPSIKEPLMYMVAIPHNPTNALIGVNVGERVLLQIIRTQNGISIGSEVRLIETRDTAPSPNHNSPLPPEKRPSRSPPVYRGSDPDSVA